MCCAFFFSSIASFTCSAVDDVFTTSPDLYSYKAEENQTSDGDLIEYFDGGYGIKSTSSDSTVKRSSAQAVSETDLTLTVNADWNVGSAPVSDSWVDKQTVFDTILSYIQSNGGVSNPKFTIDNLRIFSFFIPDWSIVYFFAFIDYGGKTAIKFSNVNGLLRVIYMSIGSPCVGWGIRTTTNEYVPMRGVTGLNPNFATYYVNADKTQNHTVSGLKLGNYTSLTLTSSHYYVDYSLSGNYSSCNLVSTIPYSKPSNTDLSFASDASGGWGVSAYPTAESYKFQAEEERHKGILGSITSLGDKIKGFFDSLLNGIKSLFIPSADYFSNYAAEMQDFFRERFGFLYQLPEAVISIFQKMITFNPKTSDYSMTFPSLSAPSVGQSGAVEWHKLTDERTFTFDFIENEPFSTLYTGYRSFVWLAYCVILLNFIVKKWNQIVGGSD